MADLVGVGTALVGVITKIVQKCEQRKENAQVLQDLRSFLQVLQDNIQQVEEKAQALRNNSVVWDLGALKKDLENAILDANKILNEVGYIRSLWDAKKIQSSVQALRDRVMTSFQTRLSIATLNVAIDGKQAQDAFQQAMLKENKELQESCFTTSISLRKELQLITTALESHHRTEAVSTIHSFQPQTSDAEEVLAALNGLSVQDQDDAASSSSSSTRNDANLLAREVDQSRENAGSMLSPSNCQSRRQLELATVGVGGLGAGTHGWVLKKKLLEEVES